MREPIYRLTFDAAELWRHHPPQMRHPHKAALLEIAYPPGSTPSGTIEVTRWAQQVDEPITLPPELATEVQANFYDYKPVGAGAAPCIEWHVNFADPRLFVAYGSALFAQDEMQVAEHPLLACVREALIARKLPAKTS